MKTYKDYLIDFDTLKIGDKLFKPNWDFCEVTNIDKKSQTFYVWKEEIGATWCYRNGLILGYENKPINYVFKEKPDFFKERKEVKKWKWYYHNAGNDYESISNSLTEKELLSFFEEFQIETQKYEKIDCTEITEVVYE